MDEATARLRGSFSEKEFYLAEFRGRAIGLVLAEGIDFATVGQTALERSA